MKPLCIIASVLFGSAWGWFLGVRSPGKESYFLNQEASRSLSALVCLVGGFIAGAIVGSVAARFLPRKLMFLPLSLLILSFVPLAITALENRADEIQGAKVEAEDRKREATTRADGKRVLDGLEKATGWVGHDSSWSVRSYTVSESPTDVQAKLVALGANELQAIGDSSTVSMKVPIEGHRIYLQLSPEGTTGSHVMAQY